VTDDGLLSTREAAEAAGVKPATLKRWAKTGVIPERRGDEEGWTPSAVAHARIVARLRERGHSLDDVRRAGEAMIRESGLNATFVRPWYILGPGHRWPYAILPIYWILERLPNTQESARRLGLVTIGQMLNALEWSIENPPAGIRIVDVPQIRRLGNRSLFADENKDSSS